MTHAKKDLPYPYCQDFSGIVTRVKGVREATRAALVNSPKVASYLKAGANLVEQNLGAQESAPSADGRKQYWSGLRFLTERALSREMENLEPPFLRQKGDGPYRATWASHDDYLNDLLTFLFHAMNYDPQYGAGLETRGDWLLTGPSFVDAVDRATYHELLAICRMPLFRLQLIITATADRNDGIHDAIANTVRRRARSVDEDLRGDDRGARLPASQGHHDRAVRQHLRRHHRGFRRAPAGRSGRRHHRRRPGRQPARDGRAGDHEQLSRTRG